MAELNERRTRTVAWVVGIVAAGLVGGNVVLLVLGRRVLNTSEGDLVFNAIAALAGVVYPAIGLLIAVRARNLIGWVLAGVGLCYGLMTFGTNYAAVGLATTAEPYPLAQEIGMAFGLLWMFAFGSLAFLLLLFPTGRPPSPRWRPVLWLGIGGLVASYLGFLVKVAPVEPAQGIRYPNPFAIEGASGIVGPGLVVAAWAIIISTVGCFVGLIIRFRRGDAQLRQQIKWLGLMAAVAGASLLVSFASLFVCECDESLVSEVMFVVLIGIVVFGVPASIAIALFRYRLYDLDLVVSKALLYGLLAALFTAVYVGVVIGMGTVVGDRGSPLLTTIAAVTIAVAFQPVRERVRRLANRIVYGERATPYEVLADFSDRVGSAYVADDVLPRMAEILGSGTGASSARVWLRSGDQLRPVASWPSNDGEGSSIRVVSERAEVFPYGEHGVEVRHQGELLGAISVAMPPDDPMNPTKERLVRDLAGQAGLGLRNVSLLQELRASRRRIVTAQDERAKQLERNLHDGAQQQLVALGVKLGLAHRIASKEAPGMTAMLDQLRAQATDALENLRDLARGIYPPLLADQGLAAALAAQARKATIPIEVEADGVGRYPQEIESAVYFCCLEAMQNVAKYANAGRVMVRLTASEEVLRFTVADDGEGFDLDSTRYGTGLQGMGDRLDSIGGALEVRSEPRAGTTVMGQIPIRG